MRHINSDDPLSLFAGVAGFQYGYVRPARVTLDTKAAVPSPVASSVARLPVRTETGTKSTAVQICDERDGTGDGGEGGGVDGRSVGSTGADATLGSDSSFSQQKQQEGSGGLGACSGAPSSACASGGIGTATSAGEGQDHLDEPSAVATRGRLGMGQEEACGDELGVGAVTPARPSVVVGEEPEEEEEPGSPPTPTSPGLADWEITEVRPNSVFSLTKTLIPHMFKANTTAVGSGYMHLCVLQSPLAFTLVFVLILTFVLL